MALIGGGGAGNVAGGNPAGVGSSLNIIRVTNKIYGYAYSGTVPTTEVETTLLDFSTGNYLLKGNIEFLYAAAKDITPNTDVFYKMEMNGLIVISYLDYQGTSTRSYSGPLNIIIPSYTHVKLTAELSAPATVNQAATITGRIYE